MDMEVPRLDLVFDESDHYYANESWAWSPGPGGAWGDPKRAMFVQREWKFLKQHLPQVEGIYVQLYVTRLDLIRVAIVGPKGTPYHDGLFFFDIAVPPGYPDRGPMVQCRSFGYKVNPCFAGSGRMKEFEMWNPQKSNLFQLLLSIQALVLNDKPYFYSTRLRTSVVQTLVRKEQLLVNKLIHGVPPDESYWEEKSLAYNEKVFIRCCKTMVSMIRNPLMNCELLIKQHFRDRADVILGACDAYRKGLVRVGQLDVEVDRKCEKVEVLSKFKNAMDQVYPDLVKALKTTGAPPVWFLFIDEVAREEMETKTMQESKGSVKAVKTLFKKKLQNFEFGQTIRRITSF